MRLKVEEALAQLANDLQTRPETRERVEAMKDELLANQSVSLWLDTLWQKGREAMIRAARNPDAAMAGKLGEVLKSMGTTLEGDPRIRSAINQFARRAVAGMAASYGGSIVKLVSETVRALGRADHHRPARNRGRPRPAIYPHQRHAGRRDPARAGCALANSCARFSGRGTSSAHLVEGVNGSDANYPSTIQSASDGSPSPANDGKNLPRV